MQNLSGELFQVRSNQLSIADAADVQLYFIDQGARSATLMEGVPNEFKLRSFKDENDVNEIVPRLNRYYGLGSGVELRYNWKTSNNRTTSYHFQQYINDIQTDTYFSIIVDNESLSIRSFLGWLELNRNYPISHRIDSTTAISLAINRMRDQGFSPSQGGQHEAALIYKKWGEDNALALWWLVKLDNGEGRDKGNGVYLINPNGEVSTSKDEFLTFQTRECDGRNNSNPQLIDCDSFTIVRDTSGNCASGYSCTTSSIWNAPYVKVDEVHDMWDDIVGGTSDVGAANAGGGGTVDIMVVDHSNSPLQGGQSAYYRVYSLQEATILIDKDVATDPGRIPHEMGHAGHATMSPNTYHLPKKDTTPPAKGAETNGVIEFIADMNELIFRNYNGSINGSPQFDSTPSWTSMSNENYAADFDHEDMDLDGSSLDDGYENARVGGHAMYMLAQQYGYETMAQLFIMTIGELIDRNGNGGLSFYEFRRAMDYWASVYEPGLTYGVANAWYEVGIGPNGSGAQNPPTDFDPGAPLPPINITSNLLTSCDSNQKSVYSVSHASSGATSYNLYYSTGGPYIWFANSSSSTTNGVFVPFDVEIKVAACNVHGCSVMSTDTEELQYWCP